MNRRPAIMSGRFSQCSRRPAWKPEIFYCKQAPLFNEHFSSNLEFGSRWIAIRESGSVLYAACDWHPSARQITSKNILKQLVGDFLVSKYERLPFRCRLVYPFEVVRLNGYDTEAINNLCTATSIQPLSEWSAISFLQTLTTRGTICSSCFLVFVPRRVQTNAINHFDFDCFNQTSILLSIVYRIKNRKSANAGLLQILTFSHCRKTRPLT